VQPRVYYLSATWLLLLLLSPPCRPEVFSDIRAMVIGRVPFATSVQSETNTSKCTAIDVRQGYHINVAS